MASSILRKLLNKPGLRPQPLRSLAPLGEPLKSHPYSSPSASQSPIQRTPFLPFLSNADDGSTARVGEGLACSLHPFHQVYYPSFPHCFAVDPVLADASFPESDAESNDEPGAVWADSVKKKRKRKMNKHKLRKLRKRLRRQT